MVAPPSRHASGSIYTWVDPEAEVAAAPTWLTRCGQDRELSRWPPVGQRNQELNRAAFALGTLTGDGELPERLVIAGLLAATAGLTVDEAHATIHSGLRAGARRPRR